MPVSTQKSKATATVGSINREVPLQHHVPTKCLGHPRMVPWLRHLFYILFKTCFEIRPKSKHECCACCSVEGTESEHHFSLFQDLASTSATFGTKLQRQQVQ